MSRTLLLSAGLLATASNAFAQTTLFTEDFNSGIVPPAGWVEVNNGISVGWEPGSSGTTAWHDDYHGLNDNSLLSPAFDGTTVTEMYLHGLQGQVYPTWREENLVEVTLDGGLTFTVVYSEDGLDSASGLPLEANLSNYAGLAGIQMNFHYIGDYANEWELQGLLVDDIAPPPPPPTWTHLPTTFMPVAGFRENFDSLGGVIPGHMAINMLDPSTRADVTGGWCNVGQMGTCVDPYDGNVSLEMGLIPGSTNYDQISNALVIGLNGAGATDMSMSFQAMHYGEEAHEDDGVFVSSDGLVWQDCVDEWYNIAGSSEYKMVVCDLASTTVDVSGQFYVAIGQQDDFPFADLDGVSVDNIAINCPVYTVSNLVTGSTAQIKLEHAAPGAYTFFVYSRTPGPSVTNFGLADFGSVYTIYAQHVVDLNGEVNFSLPMPPAGAGQTFWTQVLELTPTTSRFSNGLRMILQ
jgi:hypothetical protein